MKVILLKDVKGIGRRFEEKEVSNGHAMNFLVPRKLAVPASGSSAAQIQELKRQEDAGREKALSEIAEKVGKVAGTKLELKAAADDKGHLFEKLTAAKIAKLAGLEAEMIAIENPIKELGTYEVPVRVNGGKETSFMLEVGRA